jgi:uncharacterized protein YbcI
MVERKPVPPSGSSDDHGVLAAEISRRVVGLLREYAGRGPTKARTYIHDQLIVCVLENTLTQGERAMADGGEQTAALESRRAYQRLMREDAASAIEDLTGHRVAAFLSDHSIDPDVAIEAFVLADADAGDGTAR